MTTPTRSTPSIYDAKVLLPGLQLTPSKGVSVPDEAKALTSDGSMLVFLKKFDGNLSLFANKNVILEAVYESRGTASASAANEAAAEDSVVQDPDEEDPDKYPNENPWEPDLDEEFVDPDFETQQLVDEIEWGKAFVCF